MTAHPTRPTTSSVIARYPSSSGTDGAWLKSSSSGWWLAPFIVLTLQGCANVCTIVSTSDIVASHTEEATDVESSRLQLRIDPALLELVKSAAAKQGQTPSEWVRDTLAIAVVQTLKRGKP